MGIIRTGRKKLNLVLLLACLAGAFVGWILGELLYDIVFPGAPLLLRVGIYFATFIACVSVAAFVSELIVRHTKSVWSGREVGLAVLLIVLAIIVYFALGALFQFLYGLGYRKNITASVDDYLIAVDNSGSTDTSDPDDQRFAGVQTLVDTLTPANGFLVEVFDDGICGVLDYTSATDQAKNDLVQFNNEMIRNSGGGTDVQAVLEDILNQYQPTSGRSAAVILLSDGESSLDLDYLSDLYNSREIPIYCVAFDNMSYGGEQLMTTLAEGTEGYYCEIDDLENLSGTVQKMIALSSNRNLLERRRGRDISRILPMLLRLLFLTILGVLVEVFLTLILDYRDLMTGAMVIHALFSLLAAVIMEFILRFVASPAIMRLLMLLAMSVVAVKYMHYTYQVDDSDDYGGQGKMPGSPDPLDLARRRRSSQQGKSLV